MWAAAVGNQDSLFRDALRTMEAPLLGHGLLVHLLFWPDGTTNLPPCYRVFWDLFGLDGLFTRKACFLWLANWPARVDRLLEPCGQDLTHTHGEKRIGNTVWLSP